MMSGRFSGGGGGGNGGGKRKEVRQPILLKWYATLAWKCFLCVWLMCIFDLLPSFQLLERIAISFFWLFLTFNSKRHLVQLYFGWVKAGRMKKTTCFCSLYYHTCMRICVYLLFSALNINCQQFQCWMNCFFFLFLLLSIYSPSFSPLLLIGLFAIHLYVLRERAV